MLFLGALMRFCYILLADVCTSRTDLRSSHVASPVFCSLFDVPVLIIAPLPAGFDGETRYNGFFLPNARSVSSRLAATDTVTEDSEFSVMLMQWGQFIDHDMDHALPAFSEVSFDGQHECDRSVLIDSSSVTGQF